ncbi:hypothetical protein B0H13DRAFT_2339497 [Mycena leptocephala]|nr:hypothetical protein B0H13DRAFT_2339497 [Mycena leptocephala]
MGAIDFVAFTMIPSDCARILRHTLNLVHCELAGIIGFRPNSDRVPGFLDDLIVPLSAASTFQNESLAQSGCNLQEVCITSLHWVHEDSYRHAFSSIPEFSFDGEYVGETSDEEDWADSNIGWYE